jgi:hypothetical protein
MLYPLWDAPRFVRTYYVVTGQCKSERRENIDFYRKMGWDTFSRGWNGWGFYSYCSPRGNAWDDLDGSWTEDGAPDLMAVYPGLKECVPTRQSESAREAWEDFCLLTLMKNKGMKPDVDVLVKAYKDGAPVESLRTNGLRKLSPSFGNKLNKRK